MFFFPRSFVIVQVTSFFSFFFPIAKSGLYALKLLEGKVNTTKWLCWATKKKTLSSWWCGIDTRKLLINAYGFQALCLADNFTDWAWTNMLWNTCISWGTCNVARMNQTGCAFDMIGESGFFFNAN